MYTVVVSLHDVVRLFCRKQVPSDAAGRVWGRNTEGSGRHVSAAFVREETECRQYVAASRAGCWAVRAFCSRRRWRSEWRVKGFQFGGCFWIVHADCWQLGLELVSLCFLGCMICLYVGVCFVLPWTVESFPFMFWRWRNKLKWAPFELFAPSSLLRVRSWLHPFKGHCEQKAMRDEGLFMSLVIHYWIGDVQDSQGASISRNAN